MSMNLWDSSVYLQSTTALQHTSTQYFRLTDFGFIRLTVTEKYPDTFYPTPNDKVPGGWFSLDIHNTTVGDFNGDGRSDLVFLPMIFPHLIPHYETTLAPIILIQTPNGDFVDPKIIDAASTMPNQHFLYRVSVADFNKDGKEDIVASGMQPFNKGSVQTTYNTNDLPLVILGSGGTKFETSKNYGDLKVQDATKNIMGYNNGHSIAVGDFNNDGSIDFVSDHYQFLNSPSELGKFNARFLEYLSNTEKWFYPSINAIAPADFNKDGYADIVFSSMPQMDDGKLNGGDLRIMFGSKEGLRDGVSTVSINRENNTFENIGTNFIATIDINGDGNSDFLFLEHDWTKDTGDSSKYYSNGRIRTYLGNGDGTFVEGTERINDPYAGTRMGEGNIHVRDVNGDGWQDVVLSGYAGGSTAWQDRDYAAETSIFVNNQGRLDMMNPSEIPYLAPFQISGFEYTEQWQSRPLSKLLPVDIGDDGRVDFIGFVDTPLTSFPQVEAVHKLGFIVRSTAPLGRNTKNENLVGTKNNDKIFGYDGFDSITGGTGNDVIDGGEGLDRANYSGSRNEYQISANFAKITDLKVGREGSDDLISIERVKFADQLIALDIQGNAGQAYRLYKAALDRTPDANGLAGWIKYMDDGAALTSMAQQFIDSQEFRAKYGALDNTGFVNQLYVNVLARKGEAAGVEGWVNGLANGLTRAQVLAGFSESSENQANVIGQIKDGISYNEWWLA
jgi:serralysin